MGQEDAVALNVAAQKISAILTKLRPAEDKVLKAFSTWTEEETNDPQDVPSYSNLVNCHTSVVFEKNGCIPSVVCVTVTTTNTEFMHFA